MRQPRRFLGFKPSEVIMRITARITSRKSAIITDTSKLLLKKYRDETGLFPVEGRKLCTEAYLTGQDIREMFVTDGFLEQYASTAEDICEKYPDCRVYSVTEECLCKLTKQESPEGIICICKRIDKSEKINKIYSIMHRSEKRVGVLLCDRMADPGNLGAVLRSARALGADLISVSPDSADLYSPKVLRGSMGAAFADGITVCDTKEQIERLRSLGFTVYAAVLGKDSLMLGKEKLSDKAAVVIGNEGSGLDGETVDACDRCLCIPMKEGAESLNAAVAASVILYEMDLLD